MPTAPASSHEDAGRHGLEAFDVAAEFVGPDGGLVAEGDGNGVHDVGAARHDGVAVLLGEIEAVVAAEFHVAQDHLVGVALQKDETRVDDVLARGAPVDEFAGVLGEHGDRRNVEEIGVGVLDDDVGLFLRNDPEFGLRGGEGRFGVEPLLRPGAVAEDFAHFVGAEEEAVDLAVDGGGGHEDSPE